MSTNSSEQHTTGRVKWFNNKAGYGFITVTSGSVTGDIFVHHSALSVSEEQYKYLVQGEYVDFDMFRVEGGQHEWQAANVRGCNGGQLMCETRREMRSLRAAHASSRGSSSDDQVPALVHPRSQQPQRQPRVRSSVVRVNRPDSTSDVRPTRGVPVRFVGQAPRGADDGSEWMLVRRNTQQQQSRPHPRPRQFRQRQQQDRNTVAQE